MLQEAVHCWQRAPPGILHKSLNSCLVLKLPFTFEDIKTLAQLPAYNQTMHSGNTTTSAEWVELPYSRPLLSCLCRS